jgi:hypothetical protein
MVYYVPGTEEKDPKKIIMSLQQVHENTATNTADIATNTADIATNTADIATNTADIATNTADIATLATPPVFKIEMDTQQSITTNTYTKVSFDTLTVDSHSGWDSTNKRYVGQRSGWYRFSWHLYFGISGTLTSGFAAATKNTGTPAGTNIVAYGSTGTAANHAFSVGSGLVFLNGTTDYVELYAYITATTPIVGSTGNQGLCALSASWVRS